MSPAQGHSWPSQGALVLSDAVAGRVRRAFGAPWQGRAPRQVLSGLGLRCFFLSSPSTLVVRPLAGLWAVDRQMPDNTWDLYVPPDVMLVECSDMGCGEAPEQRVSTSSFPV